jgi:hypothetical protein
VPDQVCGECTVRYRSAAGSTIVTSGASGYYEVSVSPGAYQVDFYCPAPMNFWVPLGSVTIPAVPGYGVDIITEGCL